MGILIEILLELILQVFLQILVEMGFASVASAIRPKTKTNVVFVYVGIVIIAALTSLIFSLIYPERLFPEVPLTGLSIIFSPIFVGLAMKLFGDWLMKKGKSITILATFWGGAVFAFFFSLTRFVIFYFELLT